jgi:hypothetical protein
MNRGRALILNPTRPDSVKRREFLIKSFQSSGLEYSETIEETRSVIIWEGEPKPKHTRALARKRTLPPPLRLEQALKSRYNCDPDEVEYWDEMIRLTAERESTAVGRIQLRTTWQSEQWREAWAVFVSDHLAVNRGNGCWTITHRTTGLAAGSASTLKEAIRLARDVAQWPEWALVRSQDDITPEFKRKATEAFKAVAA